MPITRSNPVFPTPSTTKTGDYTLAGADWSVGFDATGAARTATIPSAAGYPGKIFTVRKVDSSSNLVTIARSGSDTFEGWAGSQTALHLRLQNQSVTLQSDGVSKWFVIDRYVAEVSCLATASSTTTSTNGAETAVTLNTESWDTHTMHDSVTNNTRITVPVSGRYRVRGRNRWAAGGSGGAQLFVRKNGVGSAWYAFDARAFLDSMTNEVSGTVDLVAGDYLELTQGRTAASTIANQVLANLYPEFEVTLVEPLV